MSPFLLALGNREELVRNGKLTSIIFVRDVNSKGQEVSGYIDYAHRLRSTNFEPYFERRKKVTVTYPLVRTVDVALLEEHV